MPHVVCKYKDWDLFRVIRHLTGVYFVYFSSVFNLVWCYVNCHICVDNKSLSNIVIWCRFTLLLHLYIYIHINIYIYFKWSYVFSHCPLFKSPLKGIRPITLHSVWCENKLAKNRCIYKKYMIL